MQVLGVHLLVLVGAVLGEKAAPDKPPVFSNVYSVKGELYIPYAELTEPFSAWYDGEGKRSRIDYYGDMVQTYQWGGGAAEGAGGQWGAAAKVAPVSTERELNVRRCMAVNGTSEKDQMSAQSVLPDLGGFAYVGEESVEGERASVWQLKHQIGDKLNKYTIWIKYRDSTPLPLKYEMRGFNSLLGSHYDHYTVRYWQYDPTSPLSSDIFKPPQTDGGCGSFPGPGARHMALLNPFMEWISPDMHRPHLDAEFDRFRNKHGVEYSSQREHDYRRDIFRHNLRLISMVNRGGGGGGGGGYSAAVNHLADRTPAEVAVLRGRRYTPPALRESNLTPALPFPYSRATTDALADKLPPEHDWRIFGAVTPVADQSVCGSCWSFGTAGAVEGAWFLASGQLARLSQQALVDCSWGWGNNGCDGGEDYRAYQYIMRHGLPTDEAYGAYLGQDGYCHAANATTPPPVHMRGFVNVTANDERALRLAIFKHGPISIAIDASRPTFTFYSHGVYYDPACKTRVEELDHAVLAVGYGVLNGRRYFLVKNSWSNLWGNDGYILLDASRNDCGATAAPTYPLVEATLP